MKRCECGSYSFPLHHCPLMCQGCSDGTCPPSPAAGENAAPINPTINSGEISFAHQMHVTVVPDWTPLITLLCVSVGLIMVVGVVAAELDEHQRIERERKFNTTIATMKELIRLSSSAF